jgi:hypothetical protein
MEEVILAAAGGDAAASTNSSAPPVFEMPPPLTPEQLAALPHDNQGPGLNATIWTLIAISSIFLALRVYCKFSRHRGLWWDDWILIASWVSARPFQHDIPWPAHHIAHPEPHG